MNERPKIDLHWNTTDKALETLGWLGLFFVWFYLWLNYAELPERIPTHYNFIGKADAYGDKANIIVLPLISTVVFIGLTFLNKFPHIFNYPKEITESNALHQYTLATRLIRCLKTNLVLIFGLGTYETTSHTSYSDASLGWYFLPIFLIAIFGPIVYFIIKMGRS